MTKTEEIWKPVVGYEGFYKVSNLGNVRSIDRVDCRGNRIKGRARKLLLNNVGYLYVGISVNDKKANLTVHRLVAKAFIPNPENKPQVNHIDGNKTNNVVSNLEWVTRSENTLHAYNTKLINKRKGEDSQNSKLAEWQVIEIYKMLRDGELITKLAVKYGVCETTIADIKYHRTWECVTRNFVKEEDEMSKMVYCICPKCGNKTYNYVRYGAKEWLTVHCINGCNLKFKVKITDFCK